MAARQNFEELIGKKYGKLTIIKKSDVQKNKRVSAICRCDCGNELLASLNALMRGNTKSCGCIRAERNNHYKNGLRGDPLYSVWANIKQRCYNKKFEKYPDYGGRGIIVCNEWKDNFLAFYNWANLNSYKKGLEVDRIDNDGNYSPSNCHFVTRSGNMRNTRVNVVIEYNGVKKTMREWAIDLGIPYGRLQQRIDKLKLPPERALSTKKLNRFDKT